MSSEYSKVIVGEAVEIDPLLVGAQDVEAQTYNPVVGRPVDEFRPGPRPAGVYGTYQAPVIVVRDPREQCAFFGCLFSWIPIVGIATYLVNCDAPMHSRRAYWSNMACIIATVIILINLVLWPAVYG